VQSNVVINGTIDLSGQSPNGTTGGLGGPGGWMGGNGGTGMNSASHGLGPGGGAAGYTTSNNISVLAGQASFGSQGDQAATSNNGQIQGQAAPAAVYGNIFLVPLTGGSGGGGYSTSGGGGGGGGMLVVANDVIDLGGQIIANGGDGYVSGSFGYAQIGSGGSGGAIRLLAATITGGGTLSTTGGKGFSGISVGQYFSNPTWNNAGNGRIRLDALQNNFGGTINGAATQGYQPIIFPTTTQGTQLKVSSVGGVPLSTSPTGQFVTPDAVLSAQQNNPISIVVSCANLPLNTQITVSVMPAKGPTVSATGYNSTGNLASSTATISINIPRGGGLIYATAATGN
jgi:hypothetical protein